MLTSYNKHQWSADGKTWVDVAFYSHTNRNGGSADGWPRDKGRAGDERRFLSFWGPDDSRTGGCCSSSTAVDMTHPAVPGNGESSTQWGQPVTLNYGVDLQPLRPNTGMSLVTNVAGTTLANDAFWAVECKKISSAATGIVVDMGAVSVAVRANILPLFLPLYHSTCSVHVHMNADLLLVFKTWYQLTSSPETKGARLFPSRRRCYLLRDVAVARQARMVCRRRDVGRRCL